MIRPRIDRRFARYRRTGAPQLLALVFDGAAPELWRLAAHLCRDRHDAEDALQSTFLAAIESKDSWDASRPLLPWLVGLLVNRVREQRRQRARVVDTTRLPTRDVAEPPTVAGERELGAALAQALREVTQPFRAVVEQHLVHGRSVDEIAGTIGVPAATVRTRLHRGIEQLRRRLPAQAALAAAVPMQLPADAFAAMRRTVLAQVPGGTSVAVGTGAAVVLFGWMLTKPALVGLAGATLGVAMWWTQAATAPSPTARQEVALRTPSAASARLPEHGQATGDAMAMPRVSLPSAAREAMAPAAAVGALRVLVRNGATGMPIAAVPVRATHAAAAGAPATITDRGELAPATTARADRTGDATTPHEVDGVTDADGFVVLRLAAGPAHLHVSAGLPLAHSVTVLPDVTHDCTVDVAPTFTAEVMVVDPHGAPVAEALVLAHGTHGPALQPIAQTDAAGRWRAPRTEASLAFRAVRAGYAASAPAIVSPTTGPVVLTLGDRPASLHGTVTDGRGAPVPAAVLVFVTDTAAEVRDVPLTAQADERGRYRCDWLVPGNHQILVADPREPRNRRIMTAQACAGPADAPPTDLQFPQGATLEVHLRRHDGTGMANHPVGLVAAAKDLPAAFASYLWTSGSTDANGMLVLRGIRPDRYTLATDHAHAQVRHELTLSDAAHERFVHTFAAVTDLLVTVVDADGRPRPDVHVDLHVDGTETTRRTTGAAGKAHFEHLAAGDHRVTVASADHPFGTTHTVTTDGPNRIVLSDAASGGRIVGRLHVAGGTLPTTLLVRLWRESAENALRPDFVDVPFDGATGHFECSGLTTGDYVLSIDSSDSPMLRAQQRIDVVAGGLANLGTIELGSGELRVDVRSSSGSHGLVHLAVAMTGQDVFAREAYTKAPPTLPLTRQLPAGNYRVLVWGPDIVPCFADATIAIGATTPLTLDITPGTRTEVHLPSGVGTLTLHRPDGSQLREAVLGTRTWMRGLGPGAHRVEFTAFDGTRHHAAFVVTATPGPAVELERATER